MGKPLLTDEMIERANRGEAISAPPLRDEEETKVIPTRAQTFGYASPQAGPSYSQETLQIEVEPTVTKSRRIENQKRGVFQAKLNKILLAVVLLILLLIAAIIWL
ncbi:cell wall synthase accessory phosphoprotein MacP [Streptococcus oricebi]|uniref:Foldase n=1 Tax=Streptococcus oricebi TaxID=1547447 RepID=A0ABS5B3S5_9STRE|nr:cell wall synthase accessory phosphoprotein MacP [Streptococcus oricebi]MBP2622624.1 foldase [Streptococcus oricebi]